MARYYQAGVLVGEPDPPPQTTLEEWCRAEIRLAVDKLNVAITTKTQLHQNHTLSGRMSALEDVLREIKKRA